MSYSVDQELCTGCGDCIEVCPAEAIEKNDGGGATIDDHLCILCGACDARCPQQAVLYDGQRYQPRPLPLDLQKSQISEAC